MIDPEIALTIRKLVRPTRHGCARKAAGLPFKPQVVIDRRLSFGWPDAAPIALWKPHSAVHAAIEGHAVAPDFQERDVASDDSPSLPTRLRSDAFRV